MTPNDIEQALFVGVKEHLNQRLIDLEKRMMDAKVEMDRRMVDSNHVDAKLALCLSRNEWDLAHKSVEVQIRSLELTRATLNGKASQAQVNWVMVLAVIDAIIGIIAMFHK